MASYHFSQCVIKVVKEVSDNVIWFANMTENIKGVYCYGWSKVLGYKSDLKTRGKSWVYKEVSNGFRRIKIYIKYLSKDMHSSVWKKLLIKNLYFKKRLLLNGFNNILNRELFIKPYIVMFRWGWIILTLLIILSLKNFTSIINFDKIRKNHNFLC